MRKDINMLRKLNATCARCGEHYADAVDEIGEGSVSTFLVQPVILDGPTIPSLVEELVNTDGTDHVADMLCDACVAKEFYRLRPTRKTTCCTQCGVGFQRGEPFAAISELADVGEESMDVLLGEEYPPHGPTDVYLCLSCLANIMEDASVDQSSAEDAYPITHIFAYAEQLGFWEFGDEDDDDD